MGQVCVGLCAIAVNTSGKATSRNERAPICPTAVIGKASAPVRVLYVCHGQLVEVSIKWDTCPGMIVRANKMGCGKSDGE